MTTASTKVGALFFLLHPGETQFSGYGLSVEAGRVKRLVGLLLVDRPQRASRRWLAKVERTYGDYALHPMTKTGERGMVCQMWIADNSLKHVGPLAGTHTRTLQAALFPLLLARPNPLLRVAWDGQARLWRSEFYHPEPTEVIAPAAPQKLTHRFPLGQVVATPGALDALAEAGQLPQEFLYRHSAGDWGDVDEHDREANNEAVREGQRILSAYSTKTGTRLWVITEWDRSVSTILLPSEY